jgi:SPP1 family predicted phage head-tail adaptor
MVTTWTTVTGWDSVPAAIEPLSAREFIAAQAVQSAVTARITLRYRAGLDASMRIVHNGTIYNIAGVLADPDSGLEYVTIPVSTGVNNG